MDVLKQDESGVATAELCRQHEISEQTYYRRKAKYGGMDSSEAKGLKQLEDANRKLKNVLADLTPGNRPLKDVLSKTLVAPAGLRAAVSFVEMEYEMSEGHACRVVGLIEKWIKTRRRVLVSTFIPSY
jgi:putative transposase